MYCSSCGSGVPTHLAFCNKCGAKLVGSQEHTSRPSEAAPESIIWAICALFIMGTGVIIGLMAVMKEVVKLNEGLILGITMVSFSLLIILEAVLIWLLISSRRTGREPGSLREVKESKTNELNEAPVRMLQEPLMSVTENTTRTFEPLYTERK